MFSVRKHTALVCLIAAASVPSGFAQESQAPRVAESLAAIRSRQSSSALPA